MLFESEINRVEKTASLCSLLTLLLISAWSAGAGTCCCCWNAPSSLPGLVEDPGAPREPDMQRTENGEKKKKERKRVKATQTRPPLFSFFKRE